MKNRKKIKWATMLIASALIFMFSVQNTLGYIVTKTPSIVNIFTPFESIVSGLSISKVLEHPFGAGYTIPEDMAFEFQVDLGEFYAKSAIATTAGEKEADENGVITVSVKPGASVTIQGIDEGTEVKVTEVEKAADSGFSIKDGEATREVTIEADGNAAVEFVNVYKPAAVPEVNVTVEGTKTLEGRDWQTGDSFTFVLEKDMGDEDWEALGSKTVAYDAENADFDKFSFSGVMQSQSFEEAGTYEFRVVEKKESLENVTYDEAEHRFTVTVGDADMDGYLEIQNVSSSQNAVVTKDTAADIYKVVTDFKNTYKAPELPTPDDITVDITVEKTVVNTGNITVGPEGFEFVLKDVDTKEEAALRTDGNGNAVFQLTFKAEDAGKTFHYKLTETNEGKTGMTYDSQVYDVQITIELGEDNKLKATIQEDGSKVDECVAEFKNTYHYEVNLETPDAPDTGDSNNIWIWVAVMIVSAAAVVVLLVMGKKNKEKKSK